MSNTPSQYNESVLYDINTSYPMRIRECMMLLQETLNRRFREAGFNITHKQWQILTFIRSQEGLSQKELAALYRSSKVAIVRFLERLEKEGLVYRKTDFRDKRRKQIYLTDKGKALQAELAPIALDNANHMRNGLDDLEIRELIKTLDTIAANGK